MRRLRSGSEAEMVALFLSTELPSARWKDSPRHCWVGRGSAAVMVRVPVRRVAIVRLWTTGGASALRSVSGAG